MTLFRSQREWQAASSKDRRAECGLGWEAASAVLVCRPDENRDEPATVNNAAPWDILKRREEEFTTE